MSWNKYKQVFVVTFGYLLLVSSATNIHALFCDPANITLSTQAMVDNFQQDHGPCDWVGSLTIRGADITNLRGLEGVVQSNGNVLIIDNPELLHLDGLEKLVTAGGDFEITDNASLTQIDGLISLEYVGRRLRIERNPNLENLNGLSSLHTVKSYFYINGNNSLINLNGLSSFENALTLNIFNNAQLTSLEGLDSLTGGNSLTGVKLTLRIGNNPSLRSLHGLEQIVELRDLELGNTSFNDLSGLSGLREIDENLWILNDQSLKTVDGLNSLLKVGEVRFVYSSLVNVDALLNISRLDELVIRHNRYLLDLDGLSSLAEVVGDVTILDNSLLNMCGSLSTILDKVDDAEMGPGPAGMPDVGGDVLIGDNALGCDCIFEILEPGSGRFVLNPALTDAWFDPSQNGQGFFINLFDDVGLIFIGWFTYETADREFYEPTAIIGEPYHRWLTATGGWVGTKGSLDLTLTSGGVFDSGEVVVNSPPESYGTVTIIFHSCESATLSYDLYGIASGSIPIVRVAPDNVARCQSWSNYY
ncbi:hypothetical protein ACFL1V_06675 [Pseudomonadota bacterium]